MCMCVYECVCMLIRARADVCAPWCMCRGQNYTGDQVLSSSLLGRVSCSCSAVYSKLTQELLGNSPVLTSNLTVLGQVL